MKRIFLAISFLSIVSVSCFAQDTTKKAPAPVSPQEIRKIPSVDVKTIDGKTFNTTNISNDGKPIVIDFWATWCKPCIKELNAISEVYAEWQKETGVKVIAVSIDDSRRMAGVAPLVNANSWDFQILLDPNSDFKRALGVNNPPQTFVIDGKGNIVWTHSGFADGGEIELLEVLKKVAKNQPVK